MSWSKKILITLLILPLAAMVFIGRWVNKILGKEKNPFQISEAEAQSSCWVPPSCVSSPSCGDCGGCGGSDCGGCVSDCA